MKLNHFMFLASALCLVSAGAMASGDTQYLKGNSLVTAGPSHAFTVQSGDTCYGLAANSIGLACNGAQNIAFIAHDNGGHNPMCTYSGGWHGNLTAGEAGYYACMSLESIAAR